MQTFPFPSPPPTDALRAAVRNLRRLGSLSSSTYFQSAHEAAIAALNRAERGPSEGTSATDLDEGRLTSIGRAAAQFPVSVRLGKMLALGRELQCVALVATLVAALSVRAPYLRVVDSQSEEQTKTGNSFAGIVDVKEHSEEQAPTAESHVRYLNVRQAHGKWGCGESDALSVLNTLGAYLYHSPRVRRLRIMKNAVPS